MSYRCSLPSPLQKRSKNYKELYWRFVLLSFLWLWQKVWFVLVSAGVNLGGVLAQVWEPGYFEHGGHARARGEYEFMWGTKPKEIHFSSNQCNSNFLTKSKKTPKLKTSMQSFVILGSLLQWRWQWASIGHFVFLFFSSLEFHSLRCTFLLAISLAVLSHSWPQPNQPNRFKNL